MLKEELEREQRDALEQGRDPLLAPRLDWTGEAHERDIVSLNDKLD